MDTTTRRSSQVTQPIEITAEMLAWGQLAMDRAAAKSAPKTVVAVLATSTYTVRTRSHNVTTPL